MVFALLMLTFCPAITDARTEAILAEPGSTGAVLIPVPLGLSAQARAQWMLVAMAYEVFGGVARESIRGAP